MNLSRSFLLFPKKTKDRFRFFDELLLLSFFFLGDFSVKSPKLILFDYWGEADDPFLTRV